MWWRAWLLTAAVLTCAVGALGLAMSAGANVTAIVVGVLLAYTLVGALLAVNIGGLSERLAAHYAMYPWVLRQIGRDKPGAWRGGGVIMLTFGVFVLSWMLVQWLGWRPPTLSRQAALLLLVPAGLLSCGWIAARLLRRRSS